MITIHTLPTSIKKIKCSFNNIDINITEGEHDCVSIPEYSVYYQMDDEGDLILSQICARKTKDSVQITVQPNKLNLVQIHSSTGKISLSSLLSFPKTDIYLAKGNIEISNSNLANLLLKGERLNTAIKTSCIERSSSLISPCTTFVAEDTKVSKLHVASDKGNISLSNVSSSQIKVNLGEGTCRLEGSISKTVGIVATTYGEILVEAENIQNLNIKTTAGKIKISPNYSTGYKKIFLQASSPVEGLIPEFNITSTKKLYLQNNFGSVKLR